MPKPLRFIIVPKISHPWYGEVHQGAENQAEILSRELGVEVTVEFMPPAQASQPIQDAILESAVASNPDGIAVDLVDTVGHMPGIQRIKELQIPLVLFDSPSPDATITSIGNNYAEQGAVAAERLAKLIGYSGKVAIMQGVPAAPNHMDRYQAQIKVLAKYPGIEMVDGGSDHDDIELAGHQAVAALDQHPDLKGYLCCDASGPLGIASAIKKAGKVGEVKVVSMDGIKPILDVIKEGVIDSSSATIPRMQGSMSLLMLWQKSLGIPTPRNLDTGIELITQENVDAFLSRYG
ncbi:MAG: substrate-binding domain-containing protein [Pirellulaceae bacterium]|nr:substrate-binding domain-containing protein [Pirellulaceae bacterium]